MSEPDPTVEAEDEAGLILRFMVAERTGPQRPKLAVHEVALLRKCAHILAADDASDARDVAALLALAPDIQRPGARPAPRLADLPGAEFDIERLSNEQLLQYESIYACATGAASPVVSERMEAALALVWLLDGGVRDIHRVRDCVVELLGAALLDEVHPSHAAQLNAEMGRVAALERKVAFLERQLAAGVKAAPPASAAEQAAAAKLEAATRPTIRSSNIDELSSMLSGRASDDYSYLGS